MFRRPDRARLGPGCRNAALALSLALAGCGNEGGSIRAPGSGTALFGEPALLGDAGALDGASGSDMDGGVGGGPRVRLRVHHGLPNLGRVYFCHNREQVLLDVTQNPEGGLPDVAPGTELELPVGASGLGLAEVSAYASLPALTSGSITVHYAPLLELDAGPPDAGGFDLDGRVWDPEAAIPQDADSESDGGEDGDAAASDDASLPPDAASAAGDDDASQEPGPADAGGAEQPDAVTRCGMDTLAAVLPLPMPADWLGADAGIASRFQATASGDYALTLRGTGLVLDDDVSRARAGAVRDRYLADNPADPSGAQRAYEEELRRLDAAFGPRFLLTSQRGADNRRVFALRVAHLVPDVPSSEPETTSTSPGALHLCTTVNALEGVSLGDTPVIPFRVEAELSSALAPENAYRFRFFIEADFLLEARGCVTTSLAPVAELVAPVGTFSAGGHYTLAVLGALGPESLCSPTPQASLAQRPCATSVEQLRPRVMLLED